MEYIILILLIMSTQVPQIKRVKFSSNFQIPNEQLLMDDLTLDNK